MDEKALLGLTLGQLACLILSTKPDGEFAHEVQTAHRLISRYLIAQPTSKLRNMCDEFGMYADPGNDLLCDLATEELSNRETEAWNAA